MMASSASNDGAEVDASVKTFVAEAASYAESMVQDSARSARADVVAMAADAAAALATTQNPPTLDTVASLAGDWAASAVDSSTVPAGEVVPRDVAAASYAHLRAQMAAGFEHTHLSENGFFVLHGAINRLASTGNAAGITRDDEY